jgi:alkyldihydroxyacetonephosphate synthase
VRRWNGWGDDSIAPSLPATAAALLERIVGPGSPRQDASIDEVLRTVPPSRLPAHPLLAADPLDRLTHARGQSLPDWIALRSGRIGTFPDGVARPSSDEGVRTLIDYAAAVGAVVVPFGGGTSVVGHVNPGPGDAPVLTIDLMRCAGLRRFDPRSGLATFGAGTAGPDLEAELRARGWTLGHFPQSFEQSTLGGWVATRSSGQQSLGFGRIEALFAGGRLEAPAGTLDLPPHPASAAGPDLRQLVLGSEGRLGILTEATVRASPLPERDIVEATFLADVDRAMAAVRELAQARLPLSMIRLSTPAETMTTLAMAGHPRLIALLDRYLAARGIGPRRCLLLVGVTGRGRVVSAASRDAGAIVRRHGGVAAPGGLGRRWQRERFRAPYLRNALWDAGFAVDTLETAADWERVPALLASLAPALRRGLADEGERVHAFTHLSHVYPSGSSLYTTYVFRIGADPDDTLRRWSVLKSLASRAIVEHGGTISHQHGVGVDHAPYLAAEKGPLGMAVLDDAMRRFDPAGLMNPGKLLLPDER